MMVTAKIKSKATYHKCMKELHEKNYIIYKPSYNPHEGTEVILPDLSNNCSSPIIKTSSIIERTVSKNELQKAKASSNIEQSKPNNELAIVVKPNDSKACSNTVQKKDKKDEVKNRTGSKKTSSPNFDQSESKIELPKSETSSKFDLSTPKIELLDPKNDKNTSTSSKIERTEPINELVPSVTRLNFNEPN